MAGNNKSRNTIRIIFQWAMMNAVGIALAMTMRQMAFQFGVSNGDVRLMIEGIAVGLIMGGIQTYAISQLTTGLGSWFWFSAPGWAIGWAASWAIAWQILGTQRFDMVFASRGLIVGLIIGALQWLLLKQHFPQAQWWILASGIGWAIGFVVAVTIGGAFAWVLAGAIAGIITGPLLAWMLMRTDRAHLPT